MRAFPVPRRHFSICLLTAALLPAAPAFAADNEAGRWILDLRYRFEQAGQDNALRTARAHTLRTRIGYQTAAWHGLSGLLEIDDVRGLGAAHHNDSRNGRTGYSTVADPEGTGVNQLMLRQAFRWGDARLGRQRINMDNQRFVGGVGWRQNEQTYDAAMIQFGAASPFAFTYAYLDDVDTVFGPDDPSPPSRTAPADIRGHGHLLNARYRFGESFSATAYHYRLGLDNVAVTADAPLRTLSGKTSGLRVQGRLAGTGYTAEYARQSSYAGNPWALDSRYQLIELARTWAGVQWKAGRETLGAGRGNGPGNRAFQTPLATKHAFQGWADVFLTTPADGLRDTYAGASAPLGAGQLQLAYHDFRSDRAGYRFGRELDLAYQRALPGLQGWTGMLKLARYDSDDRARSVDTDKLWVQLQYAR